MAQSSTIEWTQATWNPVIGCRKVSAGCAHCYAERMAARLAAMAEADAERGYGGRKKHYLRVINQRGRWNGDVFCDHEALDIPKRWRTGRNVFVNSMSDLFHDDVDESFIEKVFRTMVDCHQHTFQILTKRPERAADMSSRLPWPENVWMGTSVENAAVTSRVKHLKRTRAKIKFLSVEPLIGRIRRLPVSGIDWVIVGGESGPGARPMEEDWVLEIQERCQAAEVPFFFKQWGGPNKKKTGRLLKGETWDEMPASAATHRRSDANLWDRKKLVG